MTSGQPIAPLAPIIKMDGVAISAATLDRISSLKIDRSLNVPGRAVMRFDDPGYVICTDTKFTVGAQLVVQSNDTVLFNGQVTGAELTHRGRNVDFVITADDLSYRMGLGTKVRTYQMVTATEVVSTIAREYGMSVASDSTTAQLPYLIHAGSDLDLLNSLAVRTGFDWWVADDVLNFKQPAAGPTASVDLSDDLLEFSVRTTALHPGTTAVTGWGADVKRSLNGSAAIAAATLKPTAQLVTGYVGATDLNGYNAVLDASYSPATQGEAEAVATGLAQRWVSQAVTARGLTAVNPAIGLGGTVTVLNAGPSSGDYNVTAVQHTYSAGGFTTRFVSGDRRPAGLVDTLTGTDSATAARFGLLIGVVTQVAPPAETSGQVKVKFPTLSETVESNWARVAAVGGGASRGMTFLPEINDEVLVGFEGGDFSRPVVLGGLFNSQDTMVDSGVENGRVDRRRITSRTGHAIEMGDGDQPAKQYILLSLNGAQHSVTMSKEKLEVAVPSGTPLSIKAGTAGISIDNQSQLTIEAQKIILKSTTDVELSGTNITTKASVKAETTATQLAMKANATAEVSAAGQVAIKGAMVMIN